MILLLLITTPQSARLITINNHLIVPDTIVGAPTVDPCGNKRPLIIDNTTHGNITSPNYPNYYPANVDCQWEIHAQHGEAVVLTLHDIKTEFGYRKKLYISNCKSLNNVIVAEG